MKLAPELNQTISQLAQDASRKDGELTTLRAANQDKLASHLLPEKFAETWKYTKLHQLKDGHLSAASADAEAPADLPTFGTEPLIIVNGRLPATLPNWEGVELTRLTAAQTPNLAYTTFAYLNGATLDEGLHIKVAAGGQPEGLFHVIFHSTGDTPAYHNTRLVVELEANSRLNLLEHYTGEGYQLCNAVTEITAADNSVLTHCRLQSEATSCLHIGQLAIRQDRNSRVNSYQFMRATTLRRNDVNVSIQGEGAELSMAGAFIARGHGYVDNQISVDHCVPNGNSNQSYKGIAGDKGHVVFNGRVHILAGATRTNADLSNKNLLLSQGAEIDSKPELEIYNDDVKASHGTTIGQLDPDMRFYLQSRGISADEAQRILSIGFIKQELASLPFETLRDWIGDWLGHAVSEAL